MGDSINNFFGSLLNAVPSVIGAILLLLLAYIVALIAKKLVIKLISKTGLGKKLEKLNIKDGEAGTTTEFVGKLVYIIVFLLFLPAVLDKLGMTSVSQPITNMVSRFINFLPNLLGASIIMIIGLYVAKIIRDILNAVFKKIKIDALREKLGSDADIKLSETLATVVYVIIVIPITIAAITVLGIESISSPAIGMLNKIFDMIPNIFVAAVLVFIGVFVGKLVRSVVLPVLKTLGVDKLGTMISKNGEESNNLSKIIASICQYVVVGIFVLEALNSINLSVLNTIGTTILAYIPNVLVAIILIGGSIILGNWVSSLLEEKTSYGKKLGLAAKIAIIAVAVFMTLSQLKIATVIVDTSFIILIAAVAIAFAISFGIGGREFASKILKKYEEKSDKKQ